MSNKIQIPNLECCSQEVKEALETIAYASTVFPEDALNTLIANKEEVIPYLRWAVEDMLKKMQKPDDDYQLHFYGLFLLGEFQDKEFFPKLIEFVSVPQDVLDDLIGDLITSGLSDILYNTYNGDIDLLKETILNSAVGEFVRSAMLSVMAQLYFDGAIDEKDLRAFLKQIVEMGLEYDFIYCTVTDVICRGHFADMLPEIRYMLDNGLMDRMAHGDYDSCVDYMFEYRDHIRPFAVSPISTIRMLKGWAMFQTDNTAEQDGFFEKKIDKFIKQQYKRSVVQAVSHKIGRNDPCPCGSGKKYKFCCLNKPKSPLDSIESEQKRRKCLERYPDLGDKRQEDRVYLDDYFDHDSIEIDKMLYLGLMNRPGFIWDRDNVQEENRCKEYLKLAFPLFVDKVEKEGIHTFDEYNQKYSIHYFCEDWMGVLLRLLNKKDEMYKQVEKIVAEMGK